MATVPMYGQPSVAPEKLPGMQTGVSVSPDTMGAAVGRGVSDIGDVAAKLYAQEKQKADEASVLSYNVKISQLSTQLELEAKNLKGADAMQAQDIAAKKWNDGLSSLATDLHNDTQRSAASRISASYGISLQRSVMSHAETERQAQVEADTQAGLAAEFNRIKTDPVHRDEAFAVIGQIYDMHAKQKGIGRDTPAYEEGLKALASAGHSEVINSYLAKSQDLKAKEYFEANKSSMVAKDISAVEAKVEADSNLGEGMRVGYGVWNKMGAKRNTDAIDQDGMETEIEKLLKDNPKALELAKGALHEKINAFKNTVAAKDEANGNKVLGILMKGGDFIQAQATTEFKAMRPETQLKVAKLFAEGLPTQTDLPYYYGLVTLATSQDTHGQFLKMNLADPAVMSKVSRSDWNTLVSLQKSAREGDDKLIAGFRTAKEVADDSLRSINIDPTPKEGSTDAKKVAEYRRRLDVLISNDQAAKGRKLHPEEVQQLSDNLLVKTYQEGWLSGWGTTRAFEVKPGEPLNVKYEEIPAVEINKITQALKAKKLPVTNASIMATYRRKLEAMRGQ